MRYRWKRFQHRLVSLDNWTFATSFLSCKLLKLNECFFANNISKFIPFLASRTSAKVFEYFGKFALHTGRLSYFGRFSSIRGSHKISLCIISLVYHIKKIIQFSPKKEIKYMNSLRMEIIKNKIVS